ncbi:MAG: LysR family transcriptional regulator [Rhizobiales bacterium]|nr:LysR family transcriptional regulator [Hyphomicrobiales bacterium]
MDRFTALKVFRQVVELGSFADAARRLKLSPAAISKNIGELEAHLGARLLNRTTRRLSRTEAGSHYYDYVVRILDELDEADAALRPMQHKPGGLLRVTAPTTLALMTLSAALPRFLALYPDLTVDLHMDSRRINLVEEGFDLAIRMSDNLADSSLIAKKLMTMQQVVCGAPAYFEKHGAPARPEALREHNCIKFSLSGHVDEWEFSRADTQLRVAVTGRYKATSSLAVRDALLAGFGVSLLPRLYVEDHLAEGALMTVLDDWTAVTSSVYAVYPSRRHVPAKVAAFIDFVAAELSGRAARAGSPS